MVRCLSAKSACLALVGALAAAVVPSSPAPQPEIVLVRLGVDLWPDYDRRGVLVIYRGDLAPGVELPATVRLSIPAAAGPPTAVAERQADGLVNLTFERRVEGETAIIEARLTHPTLQLEYYDPALVSDGPRRSFAYQWPGDFEVGDLTVTVQQPDLAAELVTEPPAATRAPGADGLVYHTISLGARAYDEEATVSFSYSKEDDRLTVETMRQAMDPLPVVSPPAESQDEILIVVGVLATVIIVAAAGLALVRRRSSRGDLAPPAGKGRFCTQCGAESAAEDRFCHGCGSPLGSGNP